MSECDNSTESWILNRTSQDDTRLRRSLLFSFVLGLGVANHQVILFVAPVTLVVLFFERDARLRRRAVIGGAAAFLEFAGDADVSVFV